MIRNHERELRSDPHYQESFWINFDMILDDAMNYVWTNKELKSIKFIIQTRIKWCKQLTKDITSLREDLENRITALKVRESKRNKNYFVIKEIIKQFEQLLKIFLVGEKKNSKHKE